MKSSSALRCVAALSLSGAAPLGAASIINQGTRQWVEAAQSSRADMLVIGDSVVLAQGDGWDAGYIQAGASLFGLAGTGIVQNGSEGDGYGAGPVWNSGWDTSLSAIRADRRGYAWRGQALTANATPLINAFSSQVSGGTLDPQGAYDWHLWTSSADGGGSLSSWRRIDAAPYTPLTAPTPVAIATPATGLQHLVLPYAANTASPGSPQALFLTDVTNTTVFYSRLMKPGSPRGVTVSSWGYGGASTLDFLHDQWQGQGMTAEGRATWFNAMVDGGSGKLNVLIHEGFNDRNETQPSAAGNPDGNSPEAFADNMRALIAAIRGDWVATGHDYDDLSFTLVSAYKDVFEDEGGVLSQFAAQEAAIAAGDPAISYVDLYSMSPTWAEANSLGYMFDGTHANRTGTVAYARMAMEVMVPEPATLTMLSVLLLPALRRSRRRR